MMSIRALTLDRMILCYFRVRSRRLFQHGQLLLWSEARGSTRSAVTPMLRAGIAIYYATNHMTASVMQLVTSGRRQVSVTALCCCCSVRGRACQVTRSVRGSSCVIRKVSNKTSNIQQCFVFDWNF